MRTANGLDLHSPSFEKMEDEAFRVIDKFIDDNIDKVKLTVMRAEGAGIGDDPQELESIADELAYFIFSNLKFDPQYIDRFIKFHVNERTLPDYINQYLDSLKVARPVTLGSLKPVEVVDVLRKIATAIDNSENPSCEMVVHDLNQVLNSLR